MLFVSAFRESACQHFHFVYSRRICHVRPTSPRLCQYLLWKIVLRKTQVFPSNPDYTFRFRYITSDKKNRCNGVKNPLVILERACGDVLLW